MKGSTGHRVRGAALVAVLALSGLVMATEALAVDQTPKNGCTSPLAYVGAITSPDFNTGTGAASVSFINWWEIESISPDGFDLMTVEYSLDTGDPEIPRTWVEFGRLNPTSPNPGAPEFGYSNNGLQTTPTFTPTATSFALPPEALSQTNLEVRIVFNTVDETYQGFRGLGVDDIAIATGTGGSTVPTENFELTPGWIFDPADPAGAPHWQVVANNSGITVKSPEIAPDLVTLPGGDSGVLPNTSHGTHYAWFGDAATGTYCGPDFANRVPPEDPGTPPAEPTPPTPPGTVEAASRRTLADLPAPVLGKQANVEPVKGTVLVAIPARGASASVGEAIASQKGLKFVPLAEARQVPVGSFLDTRKGTVRLQSAAAGATKTQLGTFDSGLFQVLQSRKRSAKGLTDLVLKGGNVTSCTPKKKRKAGRRASAALSKKRLRSLRGSAKGRFRTRGRFSAATVRGTKWTVTDRCDGTLTKVTRGKVAVRDFRRRKTVLVKTGKSYLAKAPR